MKLYFSFLITLLLVSGCASTPAIKQVERSFASEVKSVSVVKINSDYCPQSSKISSESKWKKLVEYANGCVTKQQWSMVELAGERLNQVEPDSPWGSYYLSLSAENRGLNERALWMVDLSLKKAPNVGILRYQRGRVLWSLSFFKESIAEIKKSVGLDKSIKDAYVFLGQVNLRELNFSESLKNFNAALMLDSRDKESLIGITSAYIELDKSSEALEYASKGASLYPRVVEFRLHEAFVYENMLRQYEVALLKYREIKSLVAQKKIDGAISFNLDEKIKALETTVQKNPAKLAKGS